MHPYPLQPTYERILALACAFTDVHMKIIDDNDEQFLDHLLLWRDALLNVVQFNNRDFHLFIVITLTDSIIPKLNVRHPLDDDVVLVDEHAFSAAIR